MPSISSTLRNNFEVPAKMAVIEQSKHSFLEKGLKVYVAAFDALKESGRALTSAAAGQLFTSAKSFSGVMDLVNLPCTLASVLLMGKYKAPTAQEIRVKTSLVAIHAITFVNRLQQFGAIGLGVVPSYAKAIPVIGGRVVALSFTKILQPFVLWISAEGIVRSGKNIYTFVQEKRSQQAKFDKWNSITTPEERIEKLLSSEKYKKSVDELQQKKLEKATRWNEGVKATKLSKYNDLINVARKNRSEAIINFVADSTKFVSSALILSSDCNLASYNHMVLPVANLASAIASFVKPIFELEVAAKNSLKSEANIQAKKDNDALIDLRKKTLAAHSGPNADQAPLIAASAPAAAAPAAAIADVAAGPAE